MSPRLFNIALEKVIRKVNLRPHKKSTVKGRTIRLTYADDLILLTESQNELKTLFSRLGES